MRLWYKMFRGEKREKALKDVKRYDDAQAKQGDLVRIPTYKNGGETNPIKDGLKYLFPRFAPLMKDGGDIQNMWKAFKESANEDNHEGVKPILPFYKDGGEVPHNMIKHSSPLAMNEHGLFQHDLYNAVQQTGFGIKSYVKYV